MSPVAVVRHIDEGQLQTRRVDHARGLHVVLLETPEPAPENGHTSLENGPATEAMSEEFQARVGRLEATLERLEANIMAAFREAVAVLKEQLAAKDRQLGEHEEVWGVVMARGCEPT